MRIRFKDSKEEYQIGGIGKSTYGNGVVRHTVVGGRIIAHHGILSEGVEDITEYRTEIDEDGNEIQVEVIPEVIDESPDAPDDEWLIIDIKEWLFEHEIPFKASMTKAQLLDLVP
jgi:hypothetical protein